MIAAPDDVDEVLALQARYRFRPGRVFLMPEGTDSATLRARAEWLAPLCLEHGFRMSDRLHIHLYGEGVAIPMRVNFDALEDAKRPASEDPSFVELWRRGGGEDEVVERVVRRWRSQGR